MVFVYADGEHISVFLVYKTGGDNDYNNSGATYTFNTNPLYEIRSTPIFAEKNWGGLPMFVDGHLKYFSYDGYYWVIDDKKDGDTTPQEAQTEFKEQQSAKSNGLLPATTKPREMIDGLINYAEKYLPR